MAIATRDLDLGTGVYSLPEAARIINRSVGRASADQIRRWVRAGLSDSYEIEGNTLLSFEGLISLEMVSRFRARGVSLQAVRLAERRLRDRAPRPFANLTFYTDGQNLWTEIGDENAILEIVGQVDQMAWREAIQTFAAEILFVDGVLTRWAPTPWVELNPRVQFGEPVIAGTRVPVRTVVANLEVGTPEEVASWYGLSKEQVVGARAYFDRAA